MQRVTSLYVLLCVLVICCNGERRLVGNPDGTSVHLSPCTGDANQKWTVDIPTVGGLIKLDEDGKCLDISGYGKDDGAVIWLYSCHTDDKDPNHQNQEFAWHTDSQTIVSTLSGRCMDAWFSGGSIVVNTCSGGASQKWVYTQSDRSIRHPQTGLCLAVGNTRPCDMAPGKTLPFCDVKLTHKARIADLLPRIKDTDKVGLFGNTAAGVPSLNIPNYQWWSEALHGVAGSPGVSFGGETQHATSFPQVCTTGATFDKALWNKIGGVISTEARAFANAGNAGLTFWAPNLNIFRDPRWGRGQETPGEDPYHTAQYVKYLVTGMQQGSDPNYLKISSCCKHYDAYSLENWGGVDRHHFNAVVSQQDLSDTYYPAFESCISPNSAGGSGIMCSYNSVNGIPSCANNLLLTEVARNTWKFDGYITGDCGAVDDVQYTHAYTKTTDATCAAVLGAGMDIDCGDFLPKNLQKAVDSGAVNMSIIDRALTNLFSVQMRLGLFDPLSIQPYTQIAPSAINTQASQDLAELAALEGIVLLQNNENALPLTTAKNVAVIGPHAQATEAMQGNYYGNAPFLISPVAGLQAYYNVVYSMGTDISGTSTNGFGAACNVAKAADATILFVGINQDIESEGRDRNDITFPGVQEQLIATIANCTANPVIVVVLSGGALDLTNIKNNEKVRSIIWAGYPGQAGGRAIAKIISGKVSPSGRLAYSVHKQDFVKAVSFFDMGMRPNAATKYPGRTYRFFTGDVVYPFGFGLSYTTFSFQWTAGNVGKIQRSEIESQISNKFYSPHTAAPLANSTAVVTNTGKVTSDVTVLCFVVGPQPGVNGNPLKVLVGFERVFALQPGAKATVVFPVSAHDLSYTDINGKLYTMEGDFQLMVEDAVHTLHVV